MQQKTSTDAVDIATAYLDACHTADWERAYALLSTSAQNSISLDTYSQVKEFAGGPTDHGMSLLLAAVSALFIDAQGTVGFKYRVVGPDPNAAETVIVEVDPPASLSTDSIRINLVVENDADRGLVLSLFPSMDRTDPEGVEIAKQWSKNRSGAAT